MNQTAMPRRRTRYSRTQELIAWCFILPSLLGFLVYFLLPIITGLGISFTNFGGITQPFEFVGLRNFQRMLGDKYVLTSLKNNAIYALIFTPATLIVATLLATALHHTRHGKKFYRTMFFLPYISSMVSVAVIWRLLMNPSNGPINAVLGAIGVADPPRWLSSVDWALISIVIISVWKQFGYYMVILLAGLQTIPSYLYEAAEIDGATRLQTYRRITLPMLTPIIFLCLILLIINSFQVFDLVNVLTEGGPGISTNVLVFRIYTEAFRYGRFGYASAISLVLFVIVLGITGLQFLGQKYWVNYD